MCDKMVGQQLRTSHGCLTLSDVTRLQVGEEEGSGGGKAIALYTGTGKNVKEMIIVPEEQREFLTWTRLIKVRRRVLKYDNVAGSAFMYLCLKFMSRLCSAYE